MIRILLLGTILGATLCAQSQAFAQAKVNPECDSSNYRNEIRLMNGTSHTIQGAVASTGGFESSSYYPIESNEIRCWPRSRATYNIDIWFKDGDHEYKTRTPNGSTTTYVGGDNTVWGESLYYPAPPKSPPPVSLYVQLASCDVASDRLITAKQAENARKLITTNCQVMYTRGWKSGSGTVNTAVCEPAWNALVAANRVDDARILFTKDCLKTWCQDLSNRYSIIANVTFGTAEAEAQNSWKAFNCNTFPTCQALSDRYAIVAGVGFGFAPPDAQTYWKQTSCNAKPQTSRIASLCQEMSNKFGITANVTFGSAAPETQNSWKALGCNTKPK